MVKIQVSDYPALNAFNRFAHRSNILQNWKWRSMKNCNRHPGSETHRRLFLVELIF